ncbi:hypothetical protein CEXT_226561 [Caerostris extrusa]|uniref:Uncharacterized protein n=1 Tax=Caerostris extrusa TaxID=172846 RepID=A0AAV4YDH8_CAEEX|nr:hypothetical protein CEXT_226561 [Caerostris extrusa]
MTEYSLRQKRVYCKRMCRVVVNKATFQGLLCGTDASHTCYIVPSIDESLCQIQIRLITCNGLACRRSEKMIYRLVFNIEKKDDTFRGRTEL